MDIHKYIYVYMVCVYLGEAGEHVVAECWRRKELVDECLDQLSLENVPAGGVGQLLGGDSLLSCPLPRPFLLFSFDPYTVQVSTVPYPLL